MNEAVPPASPGVVRTYKKIVSEQSVVGVSKEQDALIASLSGDLRWKALSEHIEGLIDSLTRMESVIDDRDTVENIGFKFLACRTTIAYLRGVLNLPDSLVQSQEKTNE